MQRDINLRLIYTILILVLAIGGIVIFYQMRFEKMNAEYETVLDNYNNTIKNLTNAQRSADRNINESDVLTDRESVLVSRLEMKTKELENISTELANVKQELFEYQMNYDSLNVNFTIATGILNDHEASIGKLQEKLDTLRHDTENDASNEIILQDIGRVQDELNNLKTY